ncbi:MAG TPA: hypothetical protein VES19_11895 [Candidatus Limnocylindrales bacterium]|nr:hypothetical protein [Candidatus Limnocylindrales bacterium]
MTANTEIVAAPCGAAAGDPGLPPATDRLLVIGGRQRVLRTVAHAGQTWYEYDQGLVLDVDPASGQASVVHRYVSAPEACPEVDPAVLFKSGTRVGDRLYLSTQTEVMVLRLPDFARLAYVSLPRFNDVHHVRPTPSGDLLVANSGLDTVIEVTLAGEVVNEWNVLGEATWERFDPAVDYRRVKTTKPHHAHPNHVFLIGDEPWATRFEQRDAVSLLDPGRRIDIGLERVHDGVVHDGHVFFTTVDGKIAIADVSTLRVVDIIDLARLHPSGTRLGWCRGILPDAEGAWVGFSRIRATKLRENVGWVLRGFQRDLGTHIGRYDLASPRSLSDILLEDSELGAVFSVFPA